MAQCATTALAGAVPRPCVRGARGRFGGLGPVPGVVSPPFPPSRPACPALCVAGRPVRVSLTLGRCYAIPRGLCVPRARSGCPSGSPRVPLCVCALYSIHATTGSSGLVAALREHLQDINPSRLFAMVSLPHAATTDIFVRQLQELVTPGTQITEDLVDAWIWWFNTHQPDQGGIWVPHLGWAHTLIGPPTDPRPAPSTGGQERAAPPPRAETLGIPPYEGLAEWKSRTARDRGRNLKSMVERYPETARAAPPPREGDPTSIATIVLESGHYYQVRSTPHPQEQHWSLEAVDSMLLANAALPDSTNPLPNDQPPDPLTAIMSGAAGTWHPGHALYCLWRWAQRRWPHTRDWTTMWRFHLDGRQQLEAIPQHERMAETSTATNLGPVFAIHQIRALAMGGQLQPAIRTETEAQTAHVALVHEILRALRSFLVRRVGNHPRL